MEIEELLESISEYSAIEMISYLQRFQILDLFDMLEKFQVRDDFYYRIISLTAVLKPELFGDDYISAHFDFVCQYFRIRSFGITNAIFMAWGVTDLTNEKIFEVVESRTISGNLLLFNVIASEEGYIIYKCANIRNKSGNNDRLIIEKLNVRGMSGSDIINIVFNLGNFYTLTPTLRNDEGVKNTVLQNL
jgi:hypothetical protein